MRKYKSTYFNGLFGNKKKFLGKTKENFYTKGCFGALFLLSQHLKYKLGQNIGNEKNIQK